MLFSSMYDKCGLLQEMQTKWGIGAPPVAQKLYDATFQYEPIEWNRIGHFQDVTMRLIAQRLLPDSAHADPHERLNLLQLQRGYIPLYDPRSEWFDNRVLIIPELEVASPVEYFNVGG